MRYVSLFMICSVGIISACSDKSSYQHISGQTMGTSYHISYQHPDGVDVATIQATIDQRLNDINQSMSTYQDDSTISKFNRLPSATPLQIDADFIQVFTDSQKIYQQASQAFDPTVHPLVELWGFGGKMQVERLLSPPTDAQIQNAQAKVGLNKITLQGDNLSKSVDGVGLDFSAIAKGYAVDVIANTLKDNYNIKNYMVEIGGEISTLGVNDKGNPWKLAIDTPVVDSNISNRQSIATITQPVGESLHIATSGSYRNSIEYDGVRYSHTISPITGKPVADGVPSVTVLHDSVSMADGWATALSAVSSKQAQTLADEQNIQAIFILQNGTNGFKLHYSRAMREKFGDTPTP